MYRLRLIWIIFAFNFIGSYSQDSIVMPMTANGGFYNSCYATIWDNGLDSNYADFSNSTITISPLWTESVHLYFEMFETENFFDQLKIYDGSGIAFPLIGSYSGTQLQGQTISSTGNAITLEFISDDILTKPGFKAHVSCTLGEEENGASSLVLYPNPSNAYLQLKNINLDDIETVSIIDMQGQIIKTLWLQNEWINVNELYSGMYLVKIEMTNGQQSIQKIMKN